MAKNDGYWCLEWTCLPDRRGEHDRQVEEDTKDGEGGDDCGDCPTKIPYVSSKCVSEEEKRDLHDDGETFHDHLETPSDHPPHLELPMAATVDQGSLDVEIEPLFAKHC